MEVKPEIQTIAKIKVIGVGGSGSSAVNRMVEAKIRGVDFIVMNTDVQALHYTKAPTKLHIGKTVTRGLGAGMNPELGRKAAEEAQNEIRDLLKGSDMIFVTCGLGGGTGSGASPVVASIARDLGALTIAVVTKPFSFEGSQRRTIAEQAYDDLAEKVDAMIVIPNDRILQIVDKKTTLLDSFKAADEVLRQGVEGISDLITMPGLVNVDFADVKSIMHNAGTALMGIGTGTGENRAITAAKAAITSPLLETSIDGARGILLVITAGPDLTMHEVSEAAKIVTTSADENARVIWGTVINEAMKGEIRVTVIATGFASARKLPVAREAEPTRQTPAYTPTRFIESQDEDDDEEEKEEREVFKKKVAKPAVEAPVAKPSPLANDEDLDIPAFIRRKMN